MTHESLSAEDATLLCATDPVAQLQIGAVCFFDASPLRHADGTLRVDDLRSHIEANLHRSPRFRQRVAPIAFDAARPVWLDDDRFDISNHVRATTLPTPGGSDGLRSFVAGLLSAPLEADRPLWEMWLIDGVDDERVALVLRVHHVMADGLSLLDAVLLMLDPEPRDHGAESREWSPEPPPGADRLLFEALTARTRHQAEMALGALRSLGTMVDPRRALGGARAVAGAIASGPSTAPALPLNGPVGPRRDFTWASLSMPELLEVKRANGTTLNDVVLAVVTGALRRHLGAARSDRLAERPPRVLVPVGAAHAAPTGETSNEFSMVVVDLPIANGDPLGQLAEVHAQMERRKQGGQPSATSSLFSLIDLVPLPLLRRIGPLALSRQPFVNTAVTNVPGSRVPMYLLGAEMQQLHPIVTGVGNIALIIGVLSYVDHLGVGVTVDPDVVGDPDALIDDIRAAASELIRQSR